MQDLIIIEQPKVREVFVTENGIEPILKLIKSEIDKFPVLDVTVKKDREEIKAQVTKIKKCRSYIEGVGKDLAAAMKKEPKLVDAARKKAWDQLETWEKQVRQPLSDWEEAEEKRKEAALSAIQRIRDLATGANGLSSHMLVNLMTDVNTFNPDSFDDDFIAIAKDAKADAIIKLSAMIDERRKYEAELEEWRKAKDAQDEKDRLKLIEKAWLEEIRVAEERVRKEAEEKAIAEKARLEKEALALKAAAEKAEREKLEAIEAQRVADERAEEARKQAEADALRRIEEAKAAEAKRIEAERLAALAEEKKREANKAHAKKINGEAVKCLMQIGGVTNEIAMEIVKAIVKGQIDNVSIKY